MALHLPKPQAEIIDPDLLNYPDRIAETFKDKTIFITGGTGLIGKVLIDKLLRCCRDVKKIFLLVRSKKNKNCNQRIEEMFQGPLFQILRSDKTNNFKSKIIPVNGDVSMEGLGLSENDRNLLINEVDIVYHSAASVRFDEPFKKIALLNVRGCKYMLDLAEDMKKLKLYVHMSTAYAHTREKVIEEKMYLPPADPHEILLLLKLLSDDMFDVLESKLLGDYPNTYSFTKALAEGLVNEKIKIGNLPIIICRPSIIVPIYKHPLPGWTDNKNGPSGILIAGGKGVLRTMYMPKNTYADFLPVDLATNAICALTFVYLNNPSQRELLSVVNLTTSSIIKITWKEIIELGYRLSKDIPFDWIAWVPVKAITTSKFKHIVNFYLKQWIPAVIGDAILWCLRFEPVLMKIQNRILKSYSIFHYYTSHQWNFNNHKMLHIRDIILNPRELAVYYFDGNVESEIEPYFANAIIGARRYLLNEPDENLPTARRHMKVLVIAFPKLYKLQVGKTFQNFQKSFDQMERFKIVCDLVDEIVSYTKTS